MDYRTLIDRETAFEHLHNTNWVFVDCRFVLGQPQVGFDAYKLEHLPGARYADLEIHMSGTIVPGTTGRHPLPSRDKFIRTIELLGISNQHQIVAYDAGPGMYAARFWWMLRWLGHERVAVMDKGMAGWLSAGYDTTDEVTIVRPAKFKAGEPLAHAVNAADLEGHAIEGHTLEGHASQPLLVDAREPARFRGEHEPIDPKAGHIPGALCFPFNQNLDEEGAFKSAKELGEQFSSAGFSRSDHLICYCGSGVTACHNILCLVHAGYNEPYLYAGSWSDWITDSKRPIETG